MSKADASHSQAFTVNNAWGKKRCSAALNCKHVLGSKDSEGLKSEGKSAKRERERGINKRHWHVRDPKEELSNVRRATIKDFAVTHAGFQASITVTLFHNWALAEQL